jgi:hypothetical protein
MLENIGIVYRKQFIISLLSGLIAYSFLSKKPSFDLGIIDQSINGFIYLILFRTHVNLY